MREKYSSFNYWEKILNKNRRTRQNIFMETPPSKKSFYFHTLIFSKKNGVKNIWGYFPDMRSFIGYIQHSFLQEAFYKWIYGEQELVTRIPTISVQKIIAQGQKLNRITKEIAYKMKRDYEQVTKLWDMPLDKAEIELKRFISEFNKRWMGDCNKFIYIKFFENPEELGENVISSSLMTNSQKELENKIGMTIDEWRDICKLGTKDEKMGEKFRDILMKKLTEVF